MNYLKLKSASLWWILLTQSDAAIFSLDKILLANQQRVVALNEK